MEDKYLECAEALTNAWNAFVELDNAERLKPNLSSVDAAVQNNEQQDFRAVIDAANRIIFAKAWRADSMQTINLFR